MGEVWSNPGIPFVCPSSVAAVVYHKVSGCNTLYKELCMMEMIYENGFPIVAMIICIITLVIWGLIENSREV